MFITEHFLNPKPQTSAGSIFEGGIFRTAGARFLKPLLFRLIVTFFAEMEKGWKNPCFRP